MLDVLTKFGGYRIDHFEPNCSNASAFALYVRGGLVPGSLYSLEAKQQLYFGLALIQSVLRTSCRYAAPFLLRETG